MRHEHLEAWIDGYIRAWSTNDPDDIGALFSDDARYYTSPFAEPWQGRAGIVEGWLDRKDEPGTFTFRYQILAVDAPLGILQGWTTYVDPPREYSNIWVVRLDDAGRCTEFTEWWMQPS